VNTSKDPLPGISGPSKNNVISQNIPKPTTYRRPSQLTISIAFLAHALSLRNLHEE